MSYYIGATGEYIWEELLENTTSNVIIATNINFDAGPLTDAIQETITDALGTAVGELIAPVTEVPSATGIGVVALTALGLLSYYKLNRTAVQDVDSMVYSADYASILTPGMFDDRVRIRYDTNWFSNSFYYEGGVKKGELLTYRPEQGSNILNLDATNIKLGTIENARLPADISVTTLAGSGSNIIDIKATNLIGTIENARFPTNYGTQLGIGTSPAENTNLHIYNADNPTIRLEAGANGTPGIEFQRGATNDVNVDFKIVNDTGRLKFLSQDNVDTYQTPASEIMRMTRTQLSIYENTEINGNLLLQSVAEGTPTVEFRRGTVSDANKDYRFISQSDIFKLQFQDTLTNYSDTNNQLISINDTDTIIHKQTEFKANVLIGGDTRTIGYVGIGTTASTALHVYTAAANILRLQTAPVSGTNSIEFMRGNSTDPLTDYRLLTDTSGKFKIQYANNVLAYGATDTDLIDLSTTNTIIYKPTEFKGNVGIGTAPHATYKVDVNGTTQSTAFIGNGAGLTDLGADKISTGSLNLDRITLTTTKLYQNFNQINFAIINDKIDLPAEYSINITAYDNPTLHSDIRYKGKMSVSYDDRRNIYKLVTSDTGKIDNVAVLKYKAGDRIHIRNIANTEEDFITTTSGATIYLKTVLYKRAFSLTFNKVTDGLSNFTQVFEWESRGFSGVPQVVDYRVQDGSTFPRYNFTKLMTFVVEAGYAYYLMRLWRDPTNGLYNEVALADDFDDYLRAFGAGQTFRLESGYNQAGIDYIPRTYTPPGLSVGSSQELGGVKPRRGMAIDASTGYLDSIPLSSDLITNMNTSHFTNNTGTNKIDISSTYVAPSATKLATARNIAGTAFDGTENINITYGNLSSIPATWGESQIPSLPISKITNLQSTLDGKAPTSHSHAISDITNLQTTLDGKAPTSHTHAIADVTNLQSTLDGKAPTSHSHVIGDVTNLQSTLDGKAPTSHTHVIGDVTNLQSTLDGKAPTSHTHSIANITNLQTTLDGKQATLTAGTGITITGTTISSSSTFTPTSANLISVFNATQFVNNTGTSKIDIDVNWKPTTCSIADSAMQLVSSRNIAGVAFNGTTSIAIPFANIDGLTAELATKQATINSTAGQLIIGNGNGATTTNAGLTWNGGNTLNTTNLAVSTYATITRELTSVLSGGVDMFELRNNATNNLRFNQTWIGANDMRWQLIQKSNNVDYPVINFRNGKISVGTFSNPAYQLELVGDINITGSYRVNGNLIVIDYFSLNNKPIILQPTTTNLQVSSGYSLSVPGNMAVGTTAIATNVLQVGAGGRLRISNGATDYTLLGTIDADGATNTSIVISGNTRSTNAGNIQYLATASGGSHIFYTASTTTRMTISSSGVNINDNLGVSGRVGIATAPHATYKLDVNGTINTTNLLVNGNPVSGSKWTTATDTTRIYYNAGNVGIGTTNPQQKLDIQGINPTIKLLDTGADGNGIIQFRELNDLYGMDIAYIGNMDNKMYIRSYNNSATPTTHLAINRADGTLSIANNVWHSSVEGSQRLYYALSATTYLRGHGTTPIIFRNGADSEMMWINSSGYVGIGISPSYKLHHKCSYSDVGTGIHLDAGDTGDVNRYALTIYPFVIGSGQVGWRFRTLSFDGGNTTPLEFRHNGTLRVMADRFHESSEGETRLYFATSSTTYIRGAGNPVLISIVFRSPTQFDMAYFQASVLCCYGPVNLSDRRIKRDIEEINDDDALNKILLVQPTTYYYKDEARNRGNGKVYGFIAQQIKEVIPDAVHTTKQIIANIYKTCLVYNKREIYHSIPRDTAIDTEIQILDKEGGEKGKRYKIKEIYDDYFVIDEDIDEDECFVFGYCVDDLNALDKSYIFTLNVCATQELHRRMEAQNVIIKSQDERIKELELKVERLLNYISL